MQMVVVFLMIAFLALVCTVYAHCDAQYERRAECLERGHRAAECEVLFPVSGHGGR